MQYFVLFSTLLTTILAGCNVHWPNGTDTQPYWWQCGGIAKINSATPLNTNGRMKSSFRECFTGTYVYPISLSKPFDISMNFLNPTSNSYDSPSLKLVSQKSDIFFNFFRRWSSFSTISVLVVAAEMSFQRLVF